MNVNKPAALPDWADNYAHPGVWDQTFPALSLPDMLIQSATANPAAPLIEFMGRHFSYALILREARAFAAGLQARGIVKGDRVGLFLPNVPIYVPAYYGAMMAGACVVNFSPLYSVDELAAQVADSGTRLIVTLDVPALLPTALKVLSESALQMLVVGRMAQMLPWVKGLAIRTLGRKQLTPLPRAPDVCAWTAMLSPKQPNAIAIDPMRDLALLQYTGGTTGTPKGAMLTHQNLSANARQIQAVDPRQHQRDVILGGLPLFHVFANACVLNRTVVNGGCIAMLPRFDAGKALATLQRVKATTMPGVPTMYQAMLDHPDLAKTDFSSLRVCISGGAPLPAPLQARFQAATGARLVEGYGLTETSGVVSTNPYEGAEQPGTIGQPLPGTRLRLLDKEDPERDAAPGEPGELAVRGPQIMQGYWNRPEEAASAFVMRDGEAWLRTGDVATIADDGFVRIVDRTKDMISVGGFKVFPSQVEVVLLQHPSVRECLVLGFPDLYKGEVPRAFVTLDPESPDTDGAALKSWLNARVGKHERVDDVIVRHSLPKTMIGKLDRKALREELAGRL